MLVKPLRISYRIPSRVCQLAYHAVLELVQELLFRSRGFHEFGVAPCSKLGRPGLRFPFQTCAVSVH